MDARKAQGNTESPGLGDKGCERIHSGVMTKQCTEKLSRIVAFEPGTTPGEKAIGSRMRFVEGVTTKSLQVLPQFPGIGSSEAVTDTLGDELIAELS